MKLPKVKFININQKTELEWLGNFLTEGDEWNWSRWIFKRHPGLKLIEKINSKEDKILFLKKYINQYRKDNKSKMEKGRQRYENSWRLIEERYLSVLSSIMEIGWPSRRRSIKAFVSINPICPRFLDDWSFSIYYSYEKIGRTKEIIMHEICHFLYFEKWKEMFPDSDREMYESPHIEWHLSEILAPVILNDPRIQEILKTKAGFYREHMRIKIGNKTAPRFFNDLYKQHTKKDSSFEQFLRDAYKEIKKHKKLFG